jgi:hypothetical protein
MTTRAAFYLCERSGARILQADAGISQVGTDYQLDVTTWDALPVAAVGDAIFRAINVAVNAGGSFVLGITPIVDDVEQPEQLFSGAAGQRICQALFQVPGTRLAGRIRTTSRSGTLELEDVSYTAVPVRAFP